MDSRYTPIRYHTPEAAVTEAKTRDRLIESAVRRFYRDGFRNVGLDQVLTDVGISKTAFYKHLESKEELMLAVLEHKNRWLQGTFREMVRGLAGADGRARLRSLFDLVERIVSGDEFQGCIFINVAMEFPLPHEPAHRAAVQHKRAFEEAVAELAAEAGVPEPATLAEELCLLMDGAYVTRQVTGNPRAVAIARRLAERAIDAHLAGNAG